MRKTNHLRQTKDSTIFSAEKGDKTRRGVNLSNCWIRTASQSTGPVNPRRLGYGMAGAGLVYVERVIAGETFECPPPHTHIPSDCVANAVLCCRLSAVVLQNNRW